MTPAKLRAAAGMTQAQWAQALGVDPATVRRYEADAGLPSSRAVPPPVRQMMQLLAGQHELWALVAKPKPR